MDKEKKKVFDLIEDILRATEGRKPRKIVLDVIKEAYENDFHFKSDGCTVVNELGLDIKHPACVGHDWLYHKKTVSRYKADYWFYLANIDFGHPYRGFIRFIGVRLFGWIVYKKKVL